MKTCISRGRLALLIIPSFLLQACNKPTSEIHQSIFESGKLADGRYTHDGIGVSIEVPEGWSISDLALIQKKTYEAAILMGADPKQAELEGSSLPGAFPLLSVSKKPIEEPLSPEFTHNSHMYLEAKAKSVAKGFGAGTLTEYVQMFTNVKPPYYLSKEAEHVEIGNSRGYRATIEIRYPAATIFQDVFLLESNEHYLEVVLSTKSLEDREVLLKLVEGLRLFE